MLPNWFLESSPIFQAFFAAIFTWALTALGASLVFIRKDLPKGAFDALLGFAAGVMLAASYWSLLAPAIELSGGSPFPAAIGFLSGCIFLWGVDKVLPHLHIGLPLNQAEGIKTSWQRSVLLVLAITLHNIPEGLALGVAFGAAAFGLPEAALGSAIALAIGLGIQNLPEGAAVSLPLRREGFSRKRAFYYGQISGAVEPVAAIIGAFAVLTMEPILPYALAFAAGAMIFVVIEELIPEAQRSGDSDLASLGTVLGFTLMMLLDVTLG